MIGFKMLRSRGTELKKVVAYKKDKIQVKHILLIHFHTFLSCRFPAWHYPEFKSSSAKKRGHVNAVVYF